MKGLSRMRGNSHVRFLGEGLAVMPSSYPIERTQEFTAPAYESSEEEASPLMLRYQDAITVTDTYHETKSRFAWIGEIENERLLSALENLSEDDLKLLTLYAYEGYNESEISKVFNISQPAIHKRIMKITIFLKKF